MHIPFGHKVSRPPSNRPFGFMNIILLVPSFEVQSVALVQHSEGMGIVTWVKQSKTFNIFSSMLPSCAKKNFRSQEIKYIIDRPWLIVGSLGNFQVWSISHTIKSQRETYMSTFLLFCFTLTSTEVSTAISVYTTKPYPWGILFYTVFTQTIFHEHSNKRITLLAVNALTGETSLLVGKVLITG